MTLAVCAPAINWFLTTVKGGCHSLNWYSVLVYAYLSQLFFRSHFKKKKNECIGQIGVFNPLICVGEHLLPSRSVWHPSTCSILFTAVDKHPTTSSGLSLNLTQDCVDIRTQKVLLSLESLFVLADTLKYIPTLHQDNSQAISLACAFYFGECVCGWEMAAGPVLAHDELCVCR